MRSPLTNERDRAITILFYAIVLFLGYLFLRILTPFFAPLGWAMVLANFVYSWHEKACSEMRQGRRCGGRHAVVTLFMVGPGLMILTAFGQERGQR